MFYASNLERELLFNTPGTSLPLALYDEAVLPLERMVKDEVHTTFLSVYVPASLHLLRNDCLLKASRREEALCRHALIVLLQAVAHPTLQATPRLALELSPSHRM